MLRHVGVKIVKPDARGCSGGRAREVRAVALRGGVRGDRVHLVDGERRHAPFGVLGMQGRSNCDWRESSSVQCAAEPVERVVAFALRNGV